jgi:outer membrane immunogenic protein
MYLKCAARSIQRLARYLCYFISFVVLSAANSICNAQSRFEGFYGQVGFGYESTGFSILNVVDTLPASSYPPNGVSIPRPNPVINNSTGFAGTATLGYTYALTNQFLLGVGAEYSPLGQSTQNITDAGVMGTIAMTNSWNLFLAPGYAIDDDKQIYTKFGYSRAKITNSDAASGNQTSTLLSGYSLGLGYKQFLASHWYGFIEANFTAYRNYEISAPEPFSYQGVAYTTGTNNKSLGAHSSNALLGIGYKF